MPESKLSIAADSTKKTIVRKPQDANQYPQQKNDEDKSSDIWKCASVLWNKILNTKCQQLQEPVTVEVILQGEVTKTDGVKKFFQAGNDAEDELNEKKEMVTYSAPDAVYTCSRGNKFPEKHLALGVIVISMTGSCCVNWSLSL